MDESPPELKFTADLKVLPEKLEFEYSVTNPGDDDVYLLDLLPGVDPETRKAIVNPGAAFVCCLEDGLVHVLRGIPPLPADKMVAVRVMPLGTKLAQGESVTRKFDIALPMAEQSPYYGPLEPIMYHKLAVKTVRLTVQFLRSTVEDFDCEPSHFAPEFFRVWGKHTVGQAERLVHDFSVTNVDILKRSDNFSRI